MTTIKLALLGILIGLTCRLGFNLHYNTGLMAMIGWTLAFLKAAMDSGKDNTDNNQE